MLEWDIAILETGNGGDFTMNGNDLGIFERGENDIYLRMFGGNIEGNSKKNRRPGEFDHGYWANGLLFDHDPLISFNSETERAFNNVALTSQGRVQLEAAIAKDLEGLDLDVSVQIITDDRIRVTLRHRVTEEIRAFTWTRNPRNGDFDLSDFYPPDFY